MHPPNCGRHRDIAARNGYGVPSCRTPHGAVPASYTAAGAAAAAAGAAAVAAAAAAAALLSVS